MTTVLTLLLWFAFFSHVLAAYFDNNAAHTPDRDAFYASWIYPLIITGWILADARQRGRRPCYDYDNFLFWAFPVLGPIYLFQTRRWKAIFPLLGLGTVWAMAYALGYLITITRK